MLPGRGLIRATADGLHCAAGGFHVDPWRPVRLAILTHAHADHASPGSESYLASPTGAIVARERLGPSARIEPVPWGERRRFGDVEVSLHPAGHILGSCQVRIERVAGTAEPDEGGVWVLSGDYKDRPDRTCEPMEVVRCDTFVTESTFGLPIYRWPSDSTVFDEINSWWRENAARGRTSVLYAYSLGKSQRLLAGLDASVGPIGVHGATLRMCAAYQQAGIALPAHVHVTRETVPALRGGGLVIAPPSATGSAWTRSLRGPDGLSEAFASGWMRVRGRRRWQSVDRGFVLSDHADFDGLVRTVRETGATCVGVTHGSAAAFARYLSEHGTEAFVMPTRFQGEEDGASEIADAEPGAA